MIRVVPIARQAAKLAKKEIKKILCGLAAWREILLFQWNKNGINAL
jgi:hypothetical protein